MLLLKLAYRNLKGNLSFAIFFILNLSVGLTGYTLLDSFKGSLKGSIENRSKEMATGDLRISGRRIFSESELERAEKILSPVVAKRTHLTYMYSMASHGKNSRLVEIKATEPNYPLYGSMEVEGTKLSRLHEGAFAVIFPELQQQLDIALGDSISVGSATYEVIGTVTKDAGATWTGAAVAPRVYISKSQLSRADLIQKGSSVWNSYIFTLKDDLFLDETIESLKNELTEPGINISSHLEAGQQSGRLIGYLNDYLGLVSLAAFFLAGIGAAFLYRTYLSGKLSQAATLMSLGLRPQNAFWVAIVEILLVSSASALVSAVFSLMILPVLPALVADFLPLEVFPSLSLQPVLSTFLLATFGTLSVCFPLIKASMRVKPNILFQESRLASFTLSRSDFLWFAPGLIFFWIIASWQANSWVVGSLFFGMFIGGGILIYLAGLILLKGIEAKARNMAYPLKSTFLYMSRQKFATLTCFLALALGAMLTSLIPSLRESIYSELESPDGQKIPSLFMFDIQDDQVNSLERTLQENKTSTSLISPMVRARLTKVNGKKFEKIEKDGSYETREEERSRRFSNRGYNLTYREKLDSSETIVDGTFYTGSWSETSGKLPEISIEKRFADRLDFKLGDVLEFDVLGVPIEGKITSVRKIKWTTFQPNFFIQFQPGVLEDAPKTFVGAVNKIETIEEKNALQAAIVKTHPNVSIIDVSRIVDRLVEIIDKMSLALSMMAILCLFAGFIVLYSICRQQIKNRIWDISMMKILGSEFSTIRKIVTLEFVSIGIAAGVFGTLFSILASYILSTFVFEGVYRFSIEVPLLIILAIGLITMFVSSRTASVILKERAVSFLR